MTMTEQQVLFSLWTQMKVSLPWTPPEASGGGPNVRWKSFLPEGRLHYKASGVSSQLTPPPLPLSLR